MFIKMFLSCDRALPPTCLDDLVLTFEAEEERERIERGGE
jgi:hypothetical protein